MSADREIKRLRALEKSRLVEGNNLPIWEEAVRTMARFLDVPICIIGPIDSEWQWLKASVGWLELDPTHPQVGRFQIARSETFCSEAIERRRALSVRDTAAHPTLGQRVLVREYGIRAYLGVPLFSTEGECLGTIAVMDLAPRIFRPKEIEFAKTIARWTMREVECRSAIVPSPGISLMSPQGAHRIGEDTLEAYLIGRLLDELRTPLTSVLGMTSVLRREIYGPLRPKQKEYIRIIHNSGQYLLSLVEEILTLRELKGSDTPLELVATDLEMLCQQALKGLEPAADRKEQKIQLSVNPLHRIGVVDKGKVSQMLYHLAYRTIQSAEPGCTIRVHVYREGEDLNFAVWVSHPWLGDSLPDTELELCQIPLSEELVAGTVAAESGNPPRMSFEAGDTSHDRASVIPILDCVRALGENPSRDRLGLLFSCELAQLHGGRIAVQGSAAGYRYVISLPVTNLPSEEQEELGD